MGIVRPSNNIFANLKFDLPSSIVVFLVALPLCLGISLASDAPAFSGVISGIVGGIIVGALSGSHVSVSGPAAGLTTIVAAAIGTLSGSFEAFLTAVILAGVMQFTLGILRAGFLAQFVPNSVIRGMLAAIGLILILKQIPHAVGYDSDYEGDFAFEQKDHENTLSELWHMLGYLHYGAIIISLTSIAILLLWDSKWLKKIRLLQLIPGALVAVMSGVLLNEIFMHVAPQFFLSEKEHMVQIPIIDFSDLKNASFTSFPDFSSIANPKVWLIAVQIALVASLESLLSLEATDKIDPYKRISPPNRELRAQGIGNIVAGLIGGIPVTAVIVRSSANINAGNRSKLSAILHGALLVVCVIFLPKLINKIPFSALAAVLLLVGYKLTKPKLFVEEYKAGWNKFIPFIVTIVAILFTDLLLGIGIGMITGMIFIFSKNYSSAIRVTTLDNATYIAFDKDLYFVNKPKIKLILSDLKDNESVIIDMRKADFIDPDVVELINEFIDNAGERSIDLQIKKPLNREYANVIKYENASI